jgi:hypothetical protein
MFRALEDGRYASISEMAKTEGVELGYVGSLLRLTLPALLEGVPVEWTQQTGGPLP